MKNFLQNNWLKRKSLPKILMVLSCVIIGILCLKFSSPHLNVVNTTEHHTKKLVNTTHQAIVPEKKTTWTLTKLQALDPSKKLSTQELETLRKDFLYDTPLKETTLSFDGNQAVTFLRGNGRKMVGTYTWGEQALNLRFKDDECPECGEKVINFAILEKTEHKLVLTLASEDEGDLTQILFVFEQ